MSLTKLPIGIKEYVLSMIEPVVKPIYTQIDGYLQKYREKVTKTYRIAKLLAIWSCVFLACLWVSFFLYLILYYLFIPTVVQRESINFEKKDNGYQTRIFNPIEVFPTCKRASHFSLNLEVKEDPTARICINPMQTNNFNFDFAKEVYDINLKLIIPLIPQNFDVGSFAVRTEFINKDLYAFYADAVGYFDQMEFRAGLLKRIFRFIKWIVGFDEGHTTINVPLTQNFDNQYFDLKVINIYILEPKAVVKEGILEFRVKLTGWRYFMYHWFWITTFILTFYIAIFLFAGAVFCKIYYQTAVKWVSKINFDLFKL